MAAAGAKFDTAINYYEILDVPYSASGAEISHAYRSLMRRTHPDRFASGGERQKAEERAKLINAAFSVLSKPEVRRQYDIARRGQLMQDALMQRYTGNRASAGSASFGSMPRAAETSAAKRRRQRAGRSALIHLLVITLVFALAIAGLVIFLSLVPQVINAAGI